MSAGTRSGLLYEPDESAPLPLSAGLGLQLALMTIAVPILFPTVVMRSGGLGDAYVTWAVFAAVAICGATTMLQALRIGRFGGGHMLVMGSSAAFIGVCITAVAEGGPAMLATLVVVSALFQFALAARLAQFRRVLDPAVSGTVIMLIPVSVMPAVFEMVASAPPGSTTFAAPLCALVTLVAIVGIALKGRPSLRLWAPIIGAVVGSVVAAALGLLDAAGVAAASWVGLPGAEWPGLDLDFGSAFWALLPAFLLVTMIGTVRTVSSSVALQRVSWRERRALDFRAAQGAVNVDGVSNLICGLAGTMPNTTYSVGASLTELTGVAARGVGICTGAVFVLFAFSPKALAAVVAIPGPVVAAYLTVLVAMLFLIGIKIVVQDGLDARKGLIVGVAFWVGMGFQNDMILPGHVSEFAGGLFGNGLTSGGLAAILMSLLMAASKKRRRRIETRLELASLPDIREFLRAFAARGGGDAAMAARLDAVGEEALLTLIGRHESEEGGEARRLRLVAHEEGGEAILEFFVGPGEENLEDRVALLGESADDGPVEQEMSLRLLSHLASSVRHQQYHDVDIVTVRMRPAGGAPAAGA